MKKFLGFIFYILSILITIYWLWGIISLIFGGPCKNCPTLVALVPWWKSPEILGFLVITPVVAFIFYKIGKKLRK